LSISEFNKIKPMADETPNPLDEVEMTIDQIINIGKKVWAIVELGRPVVNVKTDVATALPKGAVDWLSLDSWQAPESRTYSVTYLNAYGTRVVEFTYRVLYIYGGSVNGQGKYIGYATLVPVELNVQWGFKFNAEANVPSVFNVGTRAEPVGGMQLNMKYHVDTVMSHVEQSQAYFIDGKGTFKKLN
jgi:hypothetical protein